jgi:hypothetical protein
MKWRTPPVPAEPQLGEVRRMDRFAFLPVKGRDGETFWLEKISVEFEYVIECSFLECGMPIEISVWKRREGTAIETAKNRIRRLKKKREYEKEKPRLWA